MAQLRTCSMSCSAIFAGTRIAVMGYAVAQHNHRMGYEYSRLGSCMLLE